MLVTCVAMPAIGARSTVLASRAWRARARPSPRCTAGYFSSGSCGSPSSWLRADASCCCSCSSCALDVTSSDPRLVEVGRRADAVVEQRGLAVVVGLVGGDALARQLDLLAEAREAALEVLEIGLDAHQPGLRLLRGQTIGLGIDGEQLVTRLQQLAFDARRCARPCRTPPA